MTSKVTAPTFGTVSFESNHITLITANYAPTRSASPRASRRDVDLSVQPFSEIPSLRTRGHVMGPLQYNSELRSLPIGSCRDRA
jgi:hypothetical protein